MVAVSTRHIEVLLPAGPSYDDAGTAIVRLSATAAESPSAGDTGTATLLLGASHTESYVRFTVYDDAGTATVVLGATAAEFPEHFGLPQAGHGDRFHTGRHARPRAGRVTTTA
jgi:hypothetical protein